jgi:hypothetical protein
MRVFVRVADEGRGKGCVPGIGSDAGLLKIVVE